MLKITKITAMLIIEIELNIKKAENFYASQHELMHWLYLALYSSSNAYSQTLRNEYLILCLDTLFYITLIIWFLNFNNIKFKLWILNWSFFILCLTILGFKIYMIQDTYLLVENVYSTISSIQTHELLSTIIPNLLLKIVSLNVYYIIFCLILITILNIILFFLIYYIIVNIKCTFKFLVFNILVAFILINFIDCLELIKNMVDFEVINLRFKSLSNIINIMLQHNKIAIHTLYWQEILNNIIFGFLKIVINKLIKIIVFFLLLLFFIYLVY